MQRPGTAMTGQDGDRELVRVLRSGRVTRPRGCELLIDAHGEALYLRCADLIGESDLLVTVLRDTLVVALAHVDRLADPTRLRAWLLAIAEAEFARHPPAERPESAGAYPVGVPTGAVSAGQRTGGAGWPAGLRLRVLSGISAAELAGCRTHVAARAGSFGGDGFPVPAPPVRPTRPVSYLLPGLVVGLCALLMLFFVLIELAGLGPGLLTDGAVRPAPPGT